MKKKGFTLIELLAVIVILTVIFVFVTPRLLKLVKDNEKTETELIEERVLNAAREYANNYDSDFYTRLVNEGDTNYIYKTDLINNGLIDEEETNKLVNLAGVKGELLEGEKVKYTLTYINNPTNEYTNEELYLMIQDLKNNTDMAYLLEMNDKINNNTTAISELNSLKTTVNSNTTKITNLTDKNSTDNVFLKTYPVGSIYISNKNTNPGTIFGGTWVSFGAGRTLVGVDTTQTEFNTVEKTGGEKTHKLTVNEMPSHKHKIYVTNQDGTTAKYGLTAALNEKTNWTLGYSVAEGGDGAHNNLQPYITVYMWKRTA